MKKDININLSRVYKLSALSDVEPHKFVLLDGEPLDSEPYSLARWAAAIRPGERIEWAEGVVINGPVFVGDTVQERGNGHKYTVLTSHGGKQVNITRGHDTADVCTYDYFYKNFVKVGKPLALDMPITLPQADCITGSSVNHMVMAFSDEIELKVRWSTDHKNAQEIVKALRNIKGSGGVVPYDN